MSLAAVVEAIRARQSFILTSHARPDGDAIGSQIALGLALEALGKTVRFVDRDPAPEPYRHFPAVDRLEVMPAFAGDADAVIVMECGTLARTDVAGLDRLFVINIDHHAGNTLYGAVNWFDESAAAVAEMAATLIDALGVTWTPAIATHLYLGISTDTGSFTRVVTRAGTTTPPSRCSGCWVAAKSSVNSCAVCHTPTRLAKWPPCSSSGTRHS